jgi:O-antigen/teichoic acid export membrane protein
MYKIKEIYKHLTENALYRNSLFLILSSAILSGFGFLFWLISAKLYAPEQIGQATALISLLNLIASFSILGIGNTLIRYLSTSKQKNAKLSLAFIVTGACAVLLYIVYRLGIIFFTPSLASMLSVPVYFLILGVGILVSTYNLLFDSIFIAFRSAKFTLIKNALLSLGKIVFPLFFISLGSFGIVTAVITSTLAAVVFSFIVLKKQFGFSFILTSNNVILRQMWRYSFGNYIANFVTTLPTYILPIYVLNKLGASESAYYYVSYMIANLLFTIPFSVSNSFVAEGSYNQENKFAHLKRSVKVTSLLLLPAILGVLVFGKYVLLAFGKAYSSSGLLLLDVLAVSSIFIAINSLCVGILRIEDRLKAMIGYSIVLSVATIGISILLTPYKLTGIGIAFMLAAMIGGLYNFIVIAKPYKHTVIAALLSAARNDKVRVT